MLPVVVVIKPCCVVEHVILCQSPEHQKEVFFQQLEDHLSNWEEYDAEDREALVDQGYETFGTGSVCLCWAMSLNEINGESDEDNPKGAGPATNEINP